MDDMAFNDWFDELTTVAYQMGHFALIKGDEKESYREYFEDGNTSGEVILMELKYACNQ